MDKRNNKQIIRKQPATYEDYAQLPDDLRYDAGKWRTGRAYTFHM